MSVRLIRCAVQVGLDLTAEIRGDYEIVLTCPSGTPSTLIINHPRDFDTGGFHWTFMTVRCWDESPAGTWTVSVRNKVRRECVSSGRKPGCVYRTAAAFTHRRIDYVQ